MDKKLVYKNPQIPSIKRGILSFLADISGVIETIFWIIISIKAVLFVFLFIYFVNTDLTTRDIHTEKFEEIIHTILK
jgi:hypothetical protein